MEMKGKKCKQTVSEKLNMFGNSPVCIIYFKSLGMYKQLRSHLYKISCHFMSLSHSKSQNIDHDFKQKYPYVRVGAFVPIRIKTS